LAVYSIKTDQKTNSISISINPNYDEGLFDVALEKTGSVGDTKLENCVLQLTSQYKSMLNYLDRPKTNYSSHRCRWSTLRIKPGQWYLFTVFLADKQIANFWQPIEPAFDADRFVKAVIGNDKSILIQFNKKFIKKSWKRLLGKDGEILIKTSATDVSQDEILFHNFICS